MNTGYYAVIPTKDRLDCLHNAVNAIKPGALQPYIIVVDNGIDAAMCGDEFYLYDERPPNISRMWNIGLNRAAELATSAGNDEWFVAVINDDVVTPCPNIITETVINNNIANVRFNCFIIELVLRINNNYSFLP